MKGKVSIRTIHGLSLDAIEAVILGEEEFEVSFLVLDASDLIFVVDEVTTSIYKQEMRPEGERNSPKALEIGWVDRVFRKTRVETAKHGGTCMDVL